MTSGLETLDVPVSVLKIILFSYNFFDCFIHILIVFCNRVRD